MKIRVYYVVEKEISVNDKFEALEEDEKMSDNEWAALANEL